MRRHLAIALAAALFTQTACFGSFGLTVKAWEFNRSVGNKWVQEIVFLAMVIIPVYGIATLVDALVLNTIEFWTGSNPLASLDGEEGKTRLVTLPDGSELKLERVSEDAMRIEHAGVVRYLERTEEGFRLVDVEGEVLSSLHNAANGDAIVRSGGTETVYGVEEQLLAGTSTTSVASWARDQALMQQQETFALH